MKTANDVILQYINELKNWAGVIILCLIFKKQLSNLLGNLETLEIQFFKRINLKLRTRRLDAGIEELKSEVSPEMLEEAVLLNETASELPVEAKLEAEAEVKSAQSPANDKFEEYPPHLRRALLAQQTLENAVAKAVEISKVKISRGGTNNGFMVSELSAQLEALKEIDVIDSRVEFLMSDLSSIWNDLFNDFEPGDSRFLSGLYQNRAVELANLIVGRALERERALNSP